jgi:hypothetical protein
MLCWKRNSRTSISFSDVSRVQELQQQLTAQTGGPVDHRPGQRHSLAGGNGNKEVTGILLDG